MLSPDGHFKRALTIQAVTAADAGQLRLTGVLDGIVTQRAGAKSVDLRLSVALMCLFRRLSRPEEGSSWTHAWPVSPLHWIAQPCRCARTAPAA
jgi:hypothetical protein